jgi:phosphoglycolate phosphatase-like HAD superfamily hydrolase
MLVYLFDIDGTLIRSGGAGVAALRQALREDFHVGLAADETEIAGRTDRAIARDMFATHNLDDSPENWERFQAGYLRRLPQNLATFEGQILPGVLKLLEELGGRSDTALGLLTGNMEAGARKKLEHFNLLHHFSFGAYGDRWFDRDDVARDAFRLLKERFDGQIAPQQIWVIGDTPYDVQCSRAIGAQALAVATGGHTREQLAACRPEVVLDNLASTADVLSEIAR